MTTHYHRVMTKILIVVAVALGPRAGVHFGGIGAEVIGVAQDVVPVSEASRLAGRGAVSICSDAIVVDPAVLGGGDQRLIRKCDTSDG